MQRIWEKTSGIFSHKIWKFILYLTRRMNPTYRDSTVRKQLFVVDSIRFDSVLVHSLPHEMKARLSRAEPQLSRMKESNQIKIEYRIENRIFLFWQPPECFFYINFFDDMTRLEFPQEKSTIKKRECNTSFSKHAQSIIVPYYCKAFWGLYSITYDVLELVFSLSPLSITHKYNIR